jgi:GNAT superfamily N-acetyltransferase
MNELNIVDIDFKKKEHKILIKTLSTKNNYHEGDILVSLKDMKFLKLYAKHQDKQLEKMVNDMSNENVFYEDDDKYRGWLIFIGTKAIGFLMYFSNEYLDVLHFLLIDKPYQNKGYGSMLFKYFLVYSTKPIIKIAQSDIDGYYEKFGFMDLKKFEKTYPHIFLVQTSEQKSKKALYYNNMK